MHLASIYIYTSKCCSLLINFGQAKIPHSLMKRHPPRCKDANFMPGYGTQGHSIIANTIACMVSRGGLHLAQGCVFIWGEKKWGDSQGGAAERCESSLTCPVAELWQNAAKAPWGGGVPRQVPPPAHRSSARGPLIDWSPPASSSY